VSETVNAARQLNKEWSTGLLNKVLRRFNQEREELVAKATQIFEGKYSHPQWLIDKIKASWPKDYQAILQANNERAPMTLRVNLTKTSRAEYLNQLLELGIEAQALPETAEAIQLTEAINVNKLPGFEQGLCYIQDLSGQLAAHLLQPKAGMRVLDACAAPGSKTTHLLSYQADIEQLVAIDVQESRLQRLAENIKRLGLDESKVKLIAEDAGYLSSWWDATPFDLILVDAPCSGTGVIRRHPDIKLLRRPKDIPEQAKVQQGLLNKLWETLKPGGKLLYSTCSILAEENELQIERFLKTHGDAKALPLNLDWGRTLDHGWQNLPGEKAADGFYYALLEKA
jgi:16S rRNA (cytosine967-C5)-methyltransferase